MRPGQDVALCFAAIFLGLALWREVLWCQRFRTWMKTEGAVKGFKSEGDGPSLPLVDYSADGKSKIFECSFCLFNPSLGEVVPVLFDAESDRAVVVTRRHRWFLSGLCGSLFFVMLGVAALSN